MKKASGGDDRGAAAREGTRSSVAERLIGEGNMIFTRKDTDGGVHAQAACVSEKEIVRQGKPDTKQDFHTRAEKHNGRSGKGLRRFPVKPAKLSNGNDDPRSL